MVNVFWGTQRFTTVESRYYCLTCRAKKVRAFLEPSTLLQGIALLELQSQRVPNTNRKCCRTWLRNGEQIPQPFPLPCDSPDSASHWLNPATWSQRERIWDNTVQGVSLPMQKEEHENTKSRLRSEGKTRNNTSMLLL